MNKSALVAALIAAIALSACGKKEEPKVEAPAPAPVAAPAPEAAKPAEAAPAAADKK